MILAFSKTENSIATMREIPAELRDRYLAQGWWTNDTLGDLLARGLAGAPDAELRVHSAVRPYRGSFAEVEHTARRLAAGLRARGVGPGDVVAFRLPNWMEAAATFWASALLGAVVVPIVHFYGRKELTHIFADARPLSRSSTAIRRASRTCSPTSRWRACCRSIRRRGR